MALPMRPEQPVAENGDDGFGTWLRLWSCLVVQAGLSPADALNLEVGRAYALLAAMRANQVGWRVAGVPYALRDAAEPFTTPEE